MRLLLDTHVFLWSLLEPSRLSSEAASALRASANELWLSPISVWEAHVLAERGRVELRPTPEAWLRAALSRLPTREAPLNHEVALESRRIQLPHRDPADRFLAATARVFDLTLLTADRLLLASESVSTLRAAYPARRPPQPTASLSQASVPCSKWAWGCRQAGQVAGARGPS